MREGCIYLEKDHVEAVSPYLCCFASSYCEKLLLNPDCTHVHMLALV